MSRVIVHSITSLDGFYEGPGGNVLDLPMDHTFDAHNLELLRGAGTVLLGRRSYELFSSFWPMVADAPVDHANPGLSETNREFSRRYNEVSKVVVSDTLTLDPAHPWAATTTVVPLAGAGSWVDGARTADGPDVVVYGSHVLWNDLLAHGRVDELHLTLGALALGGGTPLFTGPVAGLELLGAAPGERSSTTLLRYAVTLAG